MIGERRFFQIVTAMLYHFHSYSGEIWLKPSLSNGSMDEDDHILLMVT